MKMNIFLTRNSRSLLGLLAMMMSCWAWAQQRTVTGTVTTTDGEELPGVSVLVSGTTSGTITDMDGNYTLSVEGDDARLIFSFIGFEQKEVAVGSRSVVDVTMTDDLVSLDEVVVVGYGAVKKSDLTGSVSSVKAEEIAAFPALSAVQTLQGRAAGVQIQSNNGGQPGADYSIKIRGGTSINASSDPIRVVDGFVGAEMPPPEDIASIEILKDASATAIYGSRGANGVILITTKRGKAGKTKINFNSSYTTQSVLNELDLLNGEEFGDYMRQLTPAYEGGGANTNWQEEIYQTGIIANNQLSITGGNENLRYYVSGTYFDQQGVVIGSGYNRYSVNSNMDIQANDFLKLGVSLYGRRSTSEGVTTQENSGGAGQAGVISSAFRFNPDLGIYHPDGTYTTSTIGDEIDNPYALATAYERERVTDRFQTNNYAEVEIADWLTFKSTLGLTYNNWRNGEYYPSSLIAGASQNGLAEMETMKQTSVLSENYFTINKTVGDHSLTWVNGYSYQHNQSERFNAGNRQFINDAAGYWGLGNGSDPLVPGSSITESVIKSYYSRANYSFLNRYILTMTARYDGASNFAAKNKWAFFPSAALAWDMKGESFLDPVDFISQWKWRVSYGVTGNQAIGPYQSLAELASIYHSNGDQLQNALKVDNLANDQLTWESTTQFDIGADIGIYDGRVNLTVDYYRMETQDLLVQRQLPSYVGVSSQWQNIGRLENKGVELSLNTRNFVGPFTWDTDFNISFNRNKILELPDHADEFYNSAPGHFLLSNTGILREGEAVGSFYGFIYDGIYQAGDEFLPGSGFEQEAGGERFQDISGPDGVPDGELTNDDRTIIGNPNPDFIWSMNNTFTYKGFDLNVFFQGSQGNEMLNYTLMELDILTGQNNATKAALDAWTPTNPNTDVPKVTGTRSKRVSTRWVYDASYIRLKNVALGYTFPKALLAKAKISSLRMYVSAQNLLTFTEYPGLDPEVGYRNSNNSRNGNLMVGLDYGSYPNVRAFTFGINLGL